MEVIGRAGGLEEIEDEHDEYEEDGEEYEENDEE
jgi:hypothetical protein